MLKEQMIMIAVRMLLNYFIPKAELLYKEAKSGNDKKAFVLAEVETFLKLNELDGYFLKDEDKTFDFEKIGNLLEEKVKELINNKKNETK